jgi:hypothetical protein
MVRHCVLTKRARMAFKLAVGSFPILLFPVRVQAPQSLGPRFQKQLPTDAKGSFLKTDPAPVDNLEQPQDIG